LLENVNLQGARGILVNITAGENLSLGEFSEVGDTIEEFASEDATVVVGTVIDPTCKEDMHVTVVATGLGQKHGRPTKVVDNGDLSLDRDYRRLDQPTIIRRKEQYTHSHEPVRAKAIGDVPDMDYLDIPAFLRKQVD
jgi:cell division protein FtsZ